MNAIKHFVENWWLVLLILASLGVSIWRPARRLAKLAAAEARIPRHYTRVIHTKAPFRRHDFAAKADIVRREVVKGIAIALAVVFAWPLSLIAISHFLPSLPRGSLIAYQGILFVAAMGSLLALTASGSRLARRSGLVCPACGMELAGIARQGRLKFWLQDQVLETGKCPGCGKQLLDPAEVGPSENLGPDDTALWIGMCVVGVAGIIAMLYFGTRQVDAKVWARCRRLYGRAYTASDSVVIDSTPVARKGLYTCGDLRRSNEH